MNFYKHLIPVVFVTMLGGCAETCANRVVSVTFVNETDDTLFMEMYTSKCAPWKYSKEYQLEEVLPYSKAIREAGTEQIDLTGWHVWIARKSTVDNNGMDSVINAQLYDTILNYSLDQLMENDYVIKVHTVLNSSMPYE